MSALPLPEGRRGLGLIVRAHPGPRGVGVSAMECGGLEAPIVPHL